MRWIKDEFHKGVFYMLLSSVGLSFFTLFAKFGTENTAYFLLIFLRFSVPFLLLLPFLLWKTKIKELVNITQWKPQILRVIALLVYQYSIFYYLIHTTLLDATVLQNTSPLFIPILERIFYKHHYTLRVWLSILVSFAGVLCILQPTSHIFASLSIAGLLAPLGQASSQVLYAHQSRNESQRTTLFYLFLFSSILTGIIYLFSGEFIYFSDSLKSYTAFAWLNIVAMGAMSICNQAFRGIAYRFGKPSALIPFLYFSLIFSGIFDWLIFHHLPNLLSLLGAILVCVGGIMQLYKSRIKA